MPTDKRCPRGCRGCRENITLDFLVSDRFVTDLVRMSFSRLAVRESTPDSLPPWNVPSLRVFRSPPPRMSPVFGRLEETSSFAISPLLSSSSMLWDRRDANADCWLERRLSYNMLAGFQNYLCNLTGTSGCGKGRITQLLLGTSSGMAVSGRSFPRANESGLPGESSLTCKSLSCACSRPCDALSWGGLSRGCCTCRGCTCRGCTLSNCAWRACSPGTLRFAWLGCP